MSKKYTKHEVHDEARRVNELSAKYHFSHAIDAVDVLLRERLKSHREIEVVQLRKNLEQFLDIEDEANAKDLHNQLQVINNSKSHFHIYIEYCDLSDKKAARTIYSGGQLIITLPQYLFKQSIDHKGTYTHHAKELREIMAHEIGHCVLHSEDIVKLKNTQGSKNLHKDEQKEKEASWFAEKLLELRHLRNQKIKKDGTLNEIF